MIPDPPTVPASRPPGAADLLPLLVIAPAVWAVVRLAAVVPVVDLWISLVVAAAGGGLFGIPALFWALDQDKARLGVLVPLGSVAGALVPAAMFASAAVGFLVRQGPEAARWLFAHEAAFPWAGTVSWTAFGLIEVEAATSGALAALVHWFVVVRRRRPAPLR